MASYSTRGASSIPCTGIERCSCCALFNRYTTSQPSPPTQTLDGRTLFLETAPTTSADLEPLTEAHRRLQTRLRAFELKALNPKKQREAWGLWGELRDVVPESLRLVVKSTWDISRKGGDGAPFKVLLNEVRKTRGLPEEPIGG